MRVQTSLALAVTLLMPLSGQVADSKLEGCWNVDAIAKAVAKLEKSDWKDVFLDRVQSMWPTRLEASDCTNGECRSASHQGRIIDGQCQCCEKIDVEQNTSPGGGVDKSLVLTIYYSDHDRKDVLAVMRILAKAAGLKEDEAGTVGRELDQSFQWRASNGDDLFIMFFKMTHSRDIWTAYLHVDRQLIAKASKNPAEPLS